MVLYPFIKTDVWRYNPGGTTGKELTCQCRRLKRLRFNPWVGKSTAFAGLGGGGSAQSSGDLTARTRSRLDCNTNSASY